jgi:glycosyl hydrolase family 26
MSTVRPLARVAVLLPAAGALALVAFGAFGPLSHPHSSVAKGSGPSAPAVVPGVSSTPSPSASPSDHPKKKKHKSSHKPKHKAQTAPGPMAGPPPIQQPKVFKRIGGRNVCVAGGCHFLGVALHRQPELSTFIHSTKVKPTIVQIYSPFRTAFPVGWAQQMVSQGFLPQIQIDPQSTPLSAIANGKYNNVLAADASALKQVHGPVVLSFAHEMNGGWYPWGCGRTSAATYVAAFRHMVNTIRHDGASNVIWMWTASSVQVRACPLGTRYPGDKYVTWVGLDGYLRMTGDSFSGRFGQALAEVHQFSGRPVLISETGVLVGTRHAAQRITSLYRGAAAAPGVLGVVYFNSETHKFGDYRPQDNATTLSAFRRATHWYRTLS